MEGLARALLVTVLALACASLMPGAAADEGPIDHAEAAEGQACDAAGACLFAGSTSVYQNGVLVQVSRGALRDGGRFAYVGGPLGVHVRAEREAGNVDGVGVHNSIWSVAVRERGDNATNAPDHSAAASVGNTAWTYAATDPNTANHTLLVGAYLWPAAANAGLDNGNAWVAACVAVACGGHSASAP